MSFLYITRKDLLISLRDREFWLILILMPIVLTLIFSMVFGGNNENLSMFPIPISVVNLEETDDAFSLSQQFLTFLQGDELADVVAISMVDDESQLQNQIKAGTAQVGIVLPKNFSATLMGTTSAEVKIYGDSAATIVPQVVKQIVDGFLTMVEANRIRLQATMTLMAENQVDSEIMQKTFAEMISNPETQLPINFTKQVEEGKKELNFTQYYAAAMAVMFLLFTGNMGIFSILEERNQKTLLRLKTGHVTKFSLILGKFLMILIMGIAQLTILILFTKIVLKVHWADSIPGLIYISLGGVTAISALSIFIAAVTKSIKTANAVNWIAVQVLAFLGGSYIPISNMSPFLQFLSKLTFNGQALRGYMTLMEGGTLADLLPTGLILFGFGAVFLILGSYLFQYGEEGI